MRILVHDYAGHAFPIQLSRALGARGHRVVHAYCEKLVAPRGPLAPRPSDAANFVIQPVSTRSTVNKTALLRRRMQEFAYAQRLRSIVAAADPEVVLSANAPLDAQRVLLRWCRRRGRRFVFWLQDLIGVGARRVLTKRFGRVGALLGAHIESTEGRLLRGSDGVVPITEDFLPWLMRSGVEAGRSRVVPNWAPLDDLPRRSKANAWSSRYGLERCRVLLYSGTLGMKHNPELLLQLAQHFHGRQDVRVVVVSEGSGADWLAARVRDVDPGNMLLLPFQPFDALPDVLGSADVLLAILEPDAGVYSVPSKVLTALCAGRALLLAVPQTNLAARLVDDAGAGFVVDPAQPAAFVEGAERLLADPTLCSRMGECARAYAVHNFDIEDITSAFEQILRGEPHVPAVGQTKSPYAVPS